MIRVLDAAPEVPAIDISLDGKPFVKDLYYADDSGYMDLPAGEHELAVYRSGTSYPLYGPTEFNFDDDESYTMVVEGLMSDKKGLSFRVLHDEAMRLAKAA